MSQNKRITELTAISDIDDNDLLIVVDVSTGESKKQTKAAFLADLAAQVDSIESGLGATYIAVVQKGASNGVATLDAGGKVPASQLPSTVMEFKGVYNATTNSPSLADGSGDAGDVYLVSVAGTQNFGSGALTFAVGDWVVYSGSIWQKSVNSSAVVSVNGFQGVVVLTKADIGLGNVDNTSDANKPLSTAASAARSSDMNTAIAFAVAL